MVEHSTKNPYIRGLKGATTFSITTLSIKGLFVTLSIKDLKILRLKPPLKIEKLKLIF